MVLKILRGVLSARANGRPAAAAPAPVVSGFGGLGIAPGLLAALDRLGFKTPTPIQQKSIPLAIEGQDLIAIAQTGTGKTLAFGIPVLQRLAGMRGLALVLVPTRELALQVDEDLHDVGAGHQLRTAVLIGGASMEKQKQALHRKPRILVATPGRLLDHLQQRTVSLKETSILVLDEADRMLDMGFAPQINRILAVVPRDRQTMLFSATMPPEIVTLARNQMRLPVHVEIARPGTTADNVVQEVFFVEKADKTSLLDLQLKQYAGSTLVFTRTKHGAMQLARRLRSLRYSVADLHSNKTLPQRRKALDGFKSGQFRVLVATDIAARGIDVTGIELVVNYDLPSQSGDYVHRIGRTARAGRAGRAISFATFDQQSDVKEIEALIRAALTVKPLPPEFKPPPMLDPTKPVKRFPTRRRTRSRTESRGPRREYGR